MNKLRDLVDDEAFLEKIRRVKSENKQKLANYIESHHGITLNVDSIFDIHVSSSSRSPN